MATQAGPVNEGKLHFEKDDRTVGREDDRTVGREDDKMPSPARDDSLVARSRYGQRGLGKIKSTLDSFDI